MLLIHLHKDFDKLQKKHGSLELDSIYGAGCIKNPKVCFIFMNPTGKNVAADKNWKGIKAPWIGTKNTWNLLASVGLVSQNNLKTILSLKPHEWTEVFSKNLYEELASQKVYITNLGKCTQNNAAHIKDSVFKEYLTLLEEEIYEINPQIIISFGNQVSSIFLNQAIKVSEMRKKFLLKSIKDKVFNVFPIYYPVGQGMRNKALAIEDIKEIIQF